MSLDTYSQTCAERPLSWETTLRPPKDHFGGSHSEINNVTQPVPRDHLRLKTTFMWSLGVVLCHRFDCTCIYVDQYFFKQMFRWNKWSLMDHEITQFVLSLKYWNYFKIILCEKKKLADKVIKFHENIDAQYICTYKVWEKLIRNY